jgi:hypothetical protein
MENLPSSLFRTSRMCELCIVFCHINQNNAMLREFTSCKPLAFKRWRSFGSGSHWQNALVFLQIPKNILRFFNTRGKLIVMRTEELMGGGGNVRENE